MMGLEEISRSWRHEVRMMWQTQRRVGRWQIYALAMLGLALGRALVGILDGGPVGSWLLPAMLPLSLAGVGLAGWRLAEFYLQLHRRRAQEAGRQWLREWAKQVPSSGSLSPDFLGLYKLDEYLAARLEHPAGRRRPKNRSG